MRLRKTMLTIQFKKGNGQVMKPMNVKKTDKVDLNAILLNFEHYIIL
jgi:hypothetical protein